MYKFISLNVFLVVFSINAMAYPIGKVITDNQFQVITDTNTEYKSSVFNGKVTVVILWTTWCPNCLAEIPKLNHLKNIMGDKIDIIGIEVDSSKKSILSTMKKYQITFKILSDRDHFIMDKYQLRNAVPQILILNKKGMFVKSFIGPIDVDSKEFVKYFTYLSLE